MRHYSLEEDTNKHRIMAEGRGAPRCPDLKAYIPSQSLSGAFLKSIEGETEKIKKYIFNYLQGRGGTGPPVRGNDGH